MRQKEESNLNFSRFGFNSLPASQPAWPFHGSTILWPFGFAVGRKRGQQKQYNFNIIPFLLEHRSPYPVIRIHDALYSVLAFDYRAMWVCRFGWISFTSSIKCCRRYHYRHCVWLLVCDTDSGGLLELLPLLLLFLLKYAQSTWKVNATTGRLVG